MPCSNFTCVNGSCIVTGEKAECICSEGYSGEHCDVLTMCLNNSCLNGGTCTEKMGVVECICPNGFTGPTCQDIVSAQLSQDTDEQTDKTLGIALSTCLVIFFCALAILTFARYLKHKRESKLKSSPAAAIPKCKTPPEQVEAEEFDLRPMKRSSLSAVQDFFLNMNIDAPENAPGEQQIQADVKIDQYDLAKNDKQANQNDEQQSYSLVESDYVMGNIELETANTVSSGQKGSPKESVTIRQDTASNTTSTQ
ncbi:EGF domain containing protein [Trichuris trichiura]|uniref:EGF domain containing protein n=1 Tax=Trichuris trichiura TaxID=36087 RepID=A0A077ZKM8_TRITR|nr:EGF domain containing protein [Trichuris trichiura]